MKSQPSRFCRTAGPGNSGRASAFTLVEMLTAMTILTLLLFLVAQMVNSTAALTAGSNRHLAADSQARLAFDRMAIDLSQIVKRQDVDYFFQNNGSGTPGMNDQMAFYSETTGYYPSGVTGPLPKSNVSLVGYCIVNNQLVRLNKALVWNGVTSRTSGATGLTLTPPAMTYLTWQTPSYLSQTLPYVWPAAFGSSGTPDMTRSTDPDYQVVGEQIFRMELSYLVRNQTYPAQLSARPFIPTTVAALTPPLPYNGMNDVVAVVVTLAILDETSRLIVQPADLTAAAAKLQDPSYPSTPTLTPPVVSTPAALWQVHVDNGDLAGTAGNGGLPRSAAAQVRVYERYFFLGNAQ